MDTKYETLTLKNQLCFPIYLASKEIIRKYSPYLDEINLTYTQYVVMMYLWEIKKSNVKDIGKVLLLDSSTLTPVLKKLEIKGFIKRKRNKIDERNLDITITKKGLELRDKALSVPMKIKKCFNLNKEEMKVLYNLIYKVLINVERE